MGNGAEWKKCGCGQWLHVECVENTATDMNGVVRFCSNCVVQHRLCIVHEINIQLATVKCFYTVGEF